MVTGEQVTISLMAMALEDLGATAISFTAGQIGMVTDEMHTKARIKRIASERIHEQLDAGKVVIIAGFQGVTEAGHMTTLGRGGSNVTLVAIAAAIGADRVGIRVSPYGAFNDVTPHPETHAQHVHLAGALRPLGLAYIHVVDHSAMGAPAVDPATKAAIRAAFDGAVILSGGYDRARAEADLAEGKGELVAFGRPYLANADLVTRLARRAELNAPDFSTFYTPGEAGYVDYPTLD